MEFFHKIVFTLLLFVTTFLNAGIDTNKVWSAYIRGNFDVVIAARDEIINEKSNAPKIIFFKALFEPNAERAFELYQMVINKSNDGELRYQSAQKIYEYYYAKGFYVTADEFKTKFGLDKEVVVHSQGNSPTLELPPLKYIVQLGAFSDRGNAEKLIKRISSMDLSILIKTKDVSGHLLHLVWVGPFSDEKEAKKWQENIKERYGIQSKIKTMD